jgi:protein phosphatase
MTSPEILELEGYPQLLTVIDGMGGYEGGALAAEIIAETLSEAAWAPNGGDFFGAELCIKTDEKVLGSLLGAAARKMASVVQEAPEMARMGAAVAGILIREKSALIFNCGDCRVYRVSGGGIERLTREHSIVQALFEKGEIDEDGMRSHPLKNIVTSSVSPNNDGSFELYTRAVSRCEEDSFFICSDGVWEAMDVRRLTSWLTGSARDSNGLFGDLSASNCRDNISFIWQTG